MESNSRKGVLLLVFLYDWIWGWNCKGNKMMVQNLWTFFITFNFEKIKLFNVLREWMLFSCHFYSNQAWNNWYWNFHVNLPQWWEVLTKKSWKLFLKPLLVFDESDNFKGHKSFTFSNRNVSESFRQICGFTTQKFLLPNAKKNFNQRVFGSKYLSKALQPVNGSSKIFYQIELSTSQQSYWLTAI